MTARPALLLAPAGLAGCVAAIVVGGTHLVGAGALLGAGAALALSLRAAPRRSGSSTEELERHLMRCRRREEPSWVLVAHVAARAGWDPKRLFTCFRLTDSVSVSRIPHGYEVAALFDYEGLDREAVERRLRAAVGPLEATVGWACFPQDGVTLPVLLDGARAALFDRARRAPSMIVSPVVETVPAHSAAERK